MSSEPPAEIRGRRFLVLAGDGTLPILNPSPHHPFLRDSTFTTLARPTVTAFPRLRAARLGLEGQPTRAVRHWNPAVSCAEYTGEGGGRWLSSDGGGHAGHV